MKGIAFLPGFISGLLTLGIILPASSQVTSDGTTNTTVNINGNNFNILNGIQRGGNLFHSFKEFSIPSSGSAIFDNSTDVVNIINRVTGGNVSSVDGLIKANGSANLFLINPAGIVFGENARLDIGGSFVGTTAESILFEDGFEFSAVNAQNEPLLTVSIPLGLQMGVDSGTIQVQNSGHRITSGFFTPADRSQNPIGLQVGAGNTLALIGSGVNFSGGVATTDGGGHLEMGSVSDGLVKLNSTTAGLVGDYSAVTKFNDIYLAQQSLLDASGTGGSIQLQGQNISFKEGSFALLQNFGIQQPSHGITVKATGTVSLSGNTSDGKSGSFIKIENLGITPSGDINLSAEQLLLEDGANIYNWTFTPIAGGNITANITDTINIDGFVPTNPVLASSISSITLNSSKGGDVNFSAGNLRIMNSGAVTTVSAGSGQAGILRFDIADLLEIAGNNPFTAAASAVSSSAFNTGDSGSTFINTSRLLIRDSGILGSSTAASGAAGNVIVNASESVEVRGKASNSILPARIASSAFIVDPATQASLRLPPIPTGKAGSLTINTPLLSVTDEAFVTVKNDGPNSAGDLQINANSIFLNQKGSISASTASGNGGDIRLNLQENLLMRNNSVISATAAGIGNGGNLSINAPVIAGFENSDIIANAVEGNGGNINISTQGIFGLEFRDALTPDSDITASSQFGVNGTVDINNISIDPSSGLVELDLALADSSQQISTGCSTNADSSFVATGKGGIPQNPNESVNANHIWSDIRDLSAYGQGSNNVAEVRQISNKPAIVEATGFIHNTEGVIELVALDNMPLRRKQFADCSGANT